MATTEIILILLFAICFVASLARRAGIVYPIAFVAGGIVLALIPGFPSVDVPPEVLLLLFLPPLLTEAAYFTSLRDFRANLRPILQLAIGLVIATCVAVAYTVQWIAPEVGLGVGFVLGAIISPPDAVAAVALTRQVTIPKRVMTVLEGESLVNDATGLVVYKFAVAAVVTGMFSFTEASLNFGWMASAGLAIGWIVGTLYMRFFPRIQEMSVEILSTFLVPYAAYLLAESVHASGVLAVVISGLTVGWHAPTRFSPAFRIPAEAVWRMVTFVLNGIVFLLIGLHVPALFSRLQAYPLDWLLSLGVVVTVVAIVVRVLCVFGLSYGVRFLVPAIRRKDPYINWQNVFIVAWTGMRGVVSLATALALPLTIADGSPFPHRDLIIFLALVVILFTLTLQSFTLPWLTRRLSLRFEGQLLQEQWQAKKEATDAALQKLHQLCDGNGTYHSILERIESHYSDRLLALGDGPNTPINLKKPPSEEPHPLIRMEKRIWGDVLEAERKTVIALRQGYKISDDVMHDMLREIDLMYNRFANGA